MSTSVRGEYLNLNNFDIFISFQTSGSPPARGRG